MAEPIPFNNMAHVLTKLGSSAIQRTASAFGVEKELRKLTNTLDTINGVLADAERRQEESDAVKAWVRRLKDVVYDADDLLDDFETLQLQPGGLARQVSDFFSSSNQLLFRFKMSNRVKNIKEEVNEIVKEIPLLNLIQGNITHREAETGWRETHSFVLTSQIVGREENKEEIIKLLVSFDNEEILSMVAIVGIGGLGKTTLAQLVYNDPIVVQYFELKIWVCVSELFEVKLLVQKILKEVCDQDVERLELNGLKDLLHEKISQRRCLLVLDDVWNENYEKWDQLKSLLVVAGKGSKILVTTRHSKVASVMGIDSPFVLEGLKGTPSWDLFAKIAFTEESEKMLPELVEIGKEIVNMCNGVPLIIKTLGTILRLKTNESYWLSIKNNDNLLSLRDGSDNVLSVLKLSYDNLPLPLKQCFAYCALFPKDYEIKKKLLVQLWMAQGYVQRLDEGIAYEYFDELLSRSLLEVSHKDAYNNILSCKMHDLIHDLAQSVIGPEILMLEDDVKKILKQVHHVLLLNPINLEWKSLKVKHMRTFLSIPIQYDKYGPIVPFKSISSFKCVRVLSLKGFNLRKVSKSLGKLNHLRYLDLSNNWFQVLPNSITSLKNLQTLKLVDCEYLKELPKDMRELINLRHLENDGCRNLSHMPCGIGELTMLQSLPVFIAGNGRGVGRLSELKGLNNLRGELRIEGLENVRDVVVESKEENLRAKQHIQSLTLIWRRSEGQSVEDASSVLEGLQPHSNLKQLYIEEYGGGRCPSWMMSGGLCRMLPNLTTIDLRNCSRCKTLPCLIRLPHLRSLKLHHLEKVEHMEECPSEGPFFPSLQELTLFRMPKLKELWRMDFLTQSLPSFPCLTRLRIGDCNDLASLELPPSPLLSYVEIIFCGNLASLELHSSPLLSKLYISRCHNLTSLILPPSPLLSYVEIRLCYNLASLELHSSPLLSQLEIFDCPKLTSLVLPPSPLLSKLKIFLCPKLITSLLLSPCPLLSELEIGYCDELASLELHSSPLLSKLRISNCRKLASLLLSPSPLLSKLDIVKCDELASLELHSSPLLSDLSIGECPKLTSLQASSLPCLKTLLLIKVREEVLWQLMLSTTASSLEPLPADQLHQHASTLQTLKFEGCSLSATLPQWIGNLTSLTDLRICSCPQLTSLPEELGSLRLLRSLSIQECSGLIALPDCVGSLSSLKRLDIRRCPQLTSLPEGMRSLTALEILEIVDCAYLSERCRRENGEDWPKVAHVPYISIDGRRV